MQIKKDTVLHLETGRDFMFGHTDVHVPLGVGGGAVKDTTRSMCCSCLFESNSEILVRSLKILILFDLEFPLVGIYPRHRVGDMDKYLQGALLHFS